MSWLLKGLGLITFVLKWVKEIWSKKQAEKLKQEGRDEVARQSHTVALEKRIERLEDAVHQDVKSMTDEELNAQLIDPRDPDRVPGK